MRDIKFRAWNGTFMVDSAYGDWISFDGVQYTEADKKYNTPNIEIEKAKGYILMQFTGLKDKNGKGKEIYDGDFFKVKNVNVPVIWKDDGGWVVEFSDYEVTLFEFIKNDPEREVIGNIYENPELIQKDNDRVIKY